MLFRFLPVLMAPAAVIAAAAASSLISNQPAAQPDPQMQAVLDELGRLGGKPIETLTPMEARKQPTPADAVKELLKNHHENVAPQKVAKVEERTIPGPAGQLPARVYWPAGNGPFSVLVYFHGGGWVIADKDVYDATPRALVNLANCIVVSVDYRRGPEHKFPAAHEDAYATYAWALKNAASINGIPGQIAVGGESAGGNLAAAVALMARDRQQTLPKYQLLVYPIAGYDTNTASYRENAQAKPLNKAMMDWFFRQYLRDPADGQDPRINLVGANLKGLPAATIITAQIDPLRSDGEQLADRLTRAGVPVDYMNYQGVTHEFFGMGAVVAKAKQAEQHAAESLNKAFVR